MKYRLARESDATAIFAILEEVAPEIPLRIPDETYRQQLLSKVREWCALNLSVVALDQNGSIVGFQMVTGKFDSTGKLNALKLEYIGVTKLSRKHGIGPTLVQKIKRRGLPLYATVSHHNRCEMADHLLKMGFERFNLDITHLPQDYYKWLPPHGASPKGAITGT